MSEKGNSQRNTDWTIGTALPGSFIDGLGAALLKEGHLESAGHFARFSSFLSVGTAAAVVLDSYIYGPEDSYISVAGGQVVSLAGGTLGGLLGGAALSPLGPAGAFFGFAIGSFAGGYIGDGLTAIQSSDLDQRWANEGSMPTDPYSRWDAEKGTVYSGYTGAYTGYDTPSETRGPDKSPVSPGFKPEVTATASGGVGIGSGASTSFSFGGTLASAWGTFTQAVSSLFGGGTSAEKTNPLIIDLGSTSATAGDGLEFVSRLSSHVFYDFDKDGFKERTAWVGPNEGILIWDKNTNGVVDDGEMILTSFKAGSKTDMDALIKAGFDTDKDGKIEASETDGGAGDAGRLLIWQDKNVNGVSDAGDITSAFGDIVSYIEIEGTDIDAQDKDHDGNIDADETVRFNDGSIVYGTYKVVLANGSGETTAYDMAFAHDDYGYKPDTNGDTILEGSVTRKIAHVASGASLVLNDSGTYYGAEGSGGSETISVEIAGISGARNYSIDGGAGNDTLTGGEGDDFIVGGDGADKVSGGRGNDILFIDGADTLVNGGMGYDVAITSGTVGVSLDLGSASIEAVTGSDGGNDTITGSSNRNVYISGLAGNDILSGTAGKDVLLGGAGNDTLRGYDGDDYLVGGAGADSLQGEAGDDVLVIDVSDDIVGGKVTGGAGNDLLVYEGEDPKGLNLDLGALGFESAVGSNGADQLRLRHLDGAGAWVNNSEDGVLIGRDGNDILSGGSGDDLVSGDSGNDTLSGNSGSDIYLYSRGGGSDLISENGGINGGRDTIAFGAAITADQVTFALSGNNLLLTVAGADGGTVNVINWNDVAGGKQVELLSFSDGTILDIANATLRSFDDTANTYSPANTTAGTPFLIQAFGGNDTITGGLGNDIVFGGLGDDTIRGAGGHDYLNGADGVDKIYGDDGDDTLIGLAGADYLSGGNGDDYLEGGDGIDELLGGTGDDILLGGAFNDILDGGAGDDVIEGGHGNDSLRGGAGDDYYIFHREDGTDVITDIGSDDDLNNDELDAAGEDYTGDRIYFGSGISIDDLAFTMDGSDLVIGVTVDGDFTKAPTAMSDQIRITGWDNSATRLESFLFVDGLVIDTSEISNAWSGTNANNSQTDGSKASLMTGGFGDDVLKGGVGQDVIVGGNGNDTINGETNNDRLFGGDGQDTLIGGTDEDNLYGDAGNDLIYGDEQSVEGGTATADSFGTDILAGGAGNDSLHGGFGNDTYVFGWGDGLDRIYETEKGGIDTIQFGYGIWLSDLQITLSTDQVSVGLNSAQFGQTSKDGLLIDRVTATSGQIKQTVEYLRFANGYTLDFSGIQKGFSGTDKADVIDFSGGTATLSTWVSGGQGDDDIRTGSGADVLVGGRNDDVMRGGNGDDIYVLSAGDGRDTIIDSGGADNAVVLGPGLTVQDITLITNDGHMYVAFLDPRIVDGSLSSFSDYVKIDGWTGNGRHSIQWLEFSDGSSIKLSDFETGSYLSSGNDAFTGTSSGEWVDGGTGNDVINTAAGKDRVYGQLGDDEVHGGDDDDWLEGGDGADRMWGDGGEDVLNGGKGNDALVGGSGNDAVYGGEGNDTVNGEGGANSLAGGRGNDVLYRGGQGSVDGDTMGTEILFAIGDGVDTIRLAAGQNGSRDVVKIAGVNADQLWFQKTGTNDLTIQFLEGEDKMTFVDFFAGGASTFEKIQIGNRYLNDEKIANLVTAMSAYDPNDGTDGIGVTGSTLPATIKTAIESAWLYEH